MASRDLLKYVIEHSKSAIAILDKNLSYIYASSGYTRQYNIPDSDIRGSSHYDIFPDLPKKWKEVLARSLSGEVCSGDDDPFVRSDGSVLWTNWEIRPWFINNQEIGGIIIYSEVINEKREIVQALRESTESYSSIFSNIPDVCYRTDINGTIVELSPAIESVFGYERGYLLGKSILNLYWDESHRHVFLREILQKGETRNFISKMKDKSGNLKHISINSRLLYNSDGNPSHIDGIIRDITDNIMQEHESLMLHKAIEQSPVMVIITDARGDIEFVNPKFCELTGYNAEEVIGMNARQFSAFNNDNDIFDGIFKAVISGHEWRGEVQVCTKSGQRIWTNSIVAPVVNEAGEIVQFISFKEDISQLRKLNEAYKEAKEKAEESNKLKTAFLQNISHEIRTPLNAIMGFADLLKDDDLPETDRRKYADIIYNSGHGLLSMMSDIIHISKIESNSEKTDISKVNLRDLCNVMYSKFLPHSDTTGNKLHCNLTALEESDHLCTDSSKIQDVLANLLKNAFKFTSNGYIEFGLTTSDKHINFYVKDTGIGIPEEYHEKIFESFRQVNTSLNKGFDGSGLGLSISKAYVELLGGKIHVESAPGKGSTFSFSLPKC